MARRFTGGRLVIASHNPGKIDEIARLLAPFAVTVVAASDMGMDAPEESGTSFAENAAIKARAAVAAIGLPALADDSGLVVPALGGAPGLHSARWAGPERDFSQAMARLHREIVGAGKGAGDGDDAGAGADNRGAYFLCALALCWPDGHCESVEGRVDGTLVWPPRGTRGFGYDPMFVPMGHDITFGEMDPDEKHAISHRADAFRKLAAACFAA